jgi:hypothetical protein
VHGIARWVWGFEPGDRIQVIPEPVPPVPDDLPPPIRDPITVGVSGVRQDPGHFEVAALCASRGWQLNEPLWWGKSTIWLSNEAEIRRLAESTVNVCWYHTTGRGKSMAAMFCVATGRPLVLSHSTMFSALWPYTHHDGIWRAPSVSLAVLEATIEVAVRGPGISAALQQELGWDRVLQPVLAAWRAA